MASQGPTKQPCHPLVETGLIVLPTRDQTIATIAEIAELDLEDVLPITLHLEIAARGLQRFSRLQVPSYRRLVEEQWERNSPKAWLGALRDWLGGLGEWVVRGLLSPQLY